MSYLRSLNPILVSSFQDDLKTVHNALHWIKGLINVEIAEKSNGLCQSNRQYDEDMLNRSMTKKPAKKNWEAIPFHPKTFKKD